MRDDHFKERVREAADIVRVVGELVRLQPSGANRFKGLCPFHQEKTPSFHVDRGRQAFYCFGCQKGGDVFRFVMEIEGLDFFEALKSLAERNGIAMPKRDELETPQAKERDAVAAIQKVAVEYFRASLNSEARAYLDRRRLAKGSAEEFQLGYAPPGATLTKLLQQRGFSPAELAASGLIVKREDGSLYDRFRNRLMFPIHDERGNPIAFGGRALGDDEPKYLNSSDTPLYTKKRVLYNLHRAKETIRKLDYTILVEGYMDVIGVSQAGFRNVVASCGTALSEDHVRALRRHSDKIVVNFDPDTAGANATEARMLMLLEQDLQVRVLELDGDLDPDEYIAARGADAYQAGLNKAASFFHWLSDRARTRYPSTPEGRIEAFREVLKPALDRVPDKLSRLAIANDLAGYLGVEPRAVLDQLKGAPKASSAANAASAPELSAQESLLIRGLLTNPGLAPEASARLQSLTLWRDRRGAAILNAILSSAASERLRFEEVSARLNSADQKLFAATIFADARNEAVAAEQVDACLARMEAEEAARGAGELKRQWQELLAAGRVEEARAIEQKLAAIRPSRPAVRQREAKGVH